MGDDRARRLFLALLLANLTVSAFYRRRARAVETIPRSAEPASLRAARVLFTLPLLSVMLVWLIRPRWLRWSALGLPDELRILGAILAAAATPLNIWVLRTLGANVSETVLTKSTHRLVTDGPYRFVRHPLYSVGLLMVGGLTLLAADALMGLLALAGLGLIVIGVIPTEERNLESRFGDAWRRYRSRTGALLPRLRR